MRATLRVATVKVWHAYCIAITSHSACLRLACTLFSYHTSFCMMFFFSTSHPLRALFSPQVRLTERAECLVMPASCVQSDSAWRESLHLACTMVCQYTSLCVPVFYDTSHPAGIMSHSSGMHVRTGASHKRRCTGDRAMQVFPTRRHPTS